VAMLCSNLLVARVMDETQNIHERKQPLYQVIVPPRVWTIIALSSLI